MSGTSQFTTSSMVSKLSVSGSLVSTVVIQATQFSLTGTLSFFSLLIFIVGINAFNKVGL
jgi:hypothetical protein